MVTPLSSPAASASLLGGGNKASPQAHGSPLGAAEKIW